MKKQAKEETLDILSIATGEVEFNVLGKTPLICNRMSQKVLNYLLFPPPKKNAVEKASTLKHQPYEEFRASPYILKGDNDPTLIAMPGAAFKQALASAALDIPGAKKAQIGRLTWVEQWNVPVYGIPQILCSVTRSADMNRTPDVRTRAIISHWACKLVVKFVQPILKVKDIGNLLGAAGVLCGVGDWRQQKGSGSFGQFEVVSDDDERLLKIIKEGGRAAQSAAMEAPLPFDDETSELLSWFDVETARRGFKVDGQFTEKHLSRIKEGRAVENILPKSKKRVNAERSADNG